MPTSLLAQRLNEAVRTAGLNDRAGEFRFSVQLDHIGVSFKATGQDAVAAELVSFDDIETAGANPLTEKMAELLWLGTTLGARAGGQDG